MTIHKVGVALCLLGLLSILVRAQVGTVAYDKSPPRKIEQIRKARHMHCIEEAFDPETTSTLAGAQSATGMTLYVDATAPEGGTGFSWPTALRNLQDALAVAAVPANGITEIRVAQGTYKPDAGGGNSLGDREATFQLISGVAVRGGYVGLADLASPNLRDPAVYRTILSGDLHNNDPTSWDNSYHVVTGSDTNATAVLDGVTITAGRTEWYTSQPSGVGGGVYNDSGSPTLIDCEITGCESYGSGGGMHCVGSGVTTLIRCTFRQNYGYGGGSGLAVAGGHTTKVVGCRFESHASGRTGGGIRNDHGSLTILNSLFQENSVSGHGGGIMSVSGTLTIVGSTFDGNEGGWGGAISSSGGILDISHSVMVSNHARFQGGALNSSSNLSQLTNVVVSGNSAQTGGAMYVERNTTECTNCTIAYNSASDSTGGVFVGEYTQVSLLNTILWANHVSDDVTESAQVLLQPGLVVRHSCVQGLDTLTGNGNIRLAPGFRSVFQGTCPPGTIASDFRLAPGSPCADAGDNSAVPRDTLDLDNDGVGDLEPIPYDLDLQARFADDPCAVDAGASDPAFPDLPIVDMGAYELQPLPTDDVDDDGILNCVDNCPLVSNPDQSDQNADGFGDACSIVDCNGNQLPDVCEEDCNGNGSPDDCDIADGVSPDCNGNGMPDECDTDLDCNENGAPDSCDIQSGVSADCNDNGNPDECEISIDSDAPGGPYFCESDCDVDCNDNGHPDSCDVADGISLDDNGNGVPDECHVVVYVDDDAPSGGDGTSWDSALRSLSSRWRGYDADIRVAGGQYASFWLSSGMRLRGGYAGWGAPDPDLRRPREFVTQTRHVSDTVGVSGAIVDGIEISGGTVRWPYCGGGAYINGGIVRFLNCVISDNTTQRGYTGTDEPPTHAANGAGMCIENGAMVTIDRCLFVRNETGWGAGGECYAGVPQTAGTDGGSGGGIYVTGSQLTVTNTVFAFNKTGGGGCTFCSGDTGVLGHSGRGAGIYVGYGATANLRNCTRYGNEVQGVPWPCDGLGRSFEDEDATGVRSAAACIDCITWAQDGSTELNPLLVSPGLYDFRLSSGSPAIDDGDPAYQPAPGETDMAGLPRVLCGRVDRGAYEFIGDYDCDREIGVSDSQGWANCMTGPDLGPYEQGCKSLDLDVDMDVDLRDQANWQNSFGL